MPSTKSWTASNQQPCADCKRLLPLSVFAGEDICPTCAHARFMAKGEVSGACHCVLSAEPATYEVHQLALRDITDPVNRDRFMERAKREERKRKYALRELALRELSRRKLIPYVKKLDPEYQDGWFHREVAKQLEWFVEEVEARRAPVLLLQAPPRHGKSRLVSQEFPAWLLGKHPKWEVISTSHTAALANTFSKKVRERMRDKVHLAIFKDSALDPDAQSTEGWNTKAGGGYMPSGIGGPITGRGAHVLLIDDPVKNAEEAESQRTREAHWEWFTSTAYTRLAPGGGLLIIQTRWHLDDLSGRMEDLIKEMGMDNVRILRFPAVATENETHRAEGEALHPDRYPIESLDRIKSTVGRRTWNALYQQNPVPDDGSYFTRSMLRYYDAAPPTLTYYTAWDFAIGKTEKNDWTVGITVGVAPDGQMYVVDMARGRWNSYEIVEQIISQWEKWKSRAVGMERGQIQMAIGPYLNQRIRERKAFAMYIQDLKTGRRDKEARARSIQGRMEQGMVHFPHQQPWWEDMRTELMQFPNGRHDDIVDAFAWVGLMLDEMVTPYVKQNKLEKKWWKHLKGAESESSGSFMSA